MLDLKQANELLDKIGLTKKDAEGYRLRADGKGRLRLEMVTVGGQFVPYTQIGEMIEQQWKKIGIDVDVKELERNLAFTRDNNNENQIIIWANDGSEMLFLFPRHALPVDAAEAHMGMAFAKWYASKGQSGKKPDDPEMLKAFDLFRSAFGMKEEDRVKAGKEIWKIIVEQTWSIGTVGQSPAFMGVRLVKNNMGNVPDRQTNAQHVRTPYSSHADHVLLQVTETRPPAGQAAVLPLGRRRAPERVCRGVAMVAYIVRRLLLAVLTVWAISVLSFVIIHLPPGDYVTSYIASMSASGSAVSEGEATAMREQLGLDQPITVQYAKWMGLMLQGNFGMAMEWGRPVSDVIGDRMSLTVVISVAAIIFTWAVALPIGIYSAVYRYSILDYAFTFIGFIGLAIPGFMLALIVMYVGFAYFGANVGGLFSPDFAEAPWSWGRVWDLIEHLPIPAIVLGISGTAQLIRIMRANLLDELRKPYVMTARARGLPEYRVILKYPVRVALNPFVSTIGYLLPYVVSGSIIVSLVLSLPTVGPLLLKALIAQDMFLAGTIVLLLGVLTVIGTFISDLLLMWVDPRIRRGQQ